MIKNKIEKILENVHIFDPKSIHPLYYEGTILLVDIDEKLYFIEDKNVYMLSCYPAEPCIYMHSANGITIVIHNSFSIYEIYKLAASNSVIGTITGNEHDIQGLCDILFCAAKLACNSCVIEELERLVTIKKLKKAGAVSANTAVDIRTFGIKNINIFDTNELSKTEDGRYYLQSNNKG